MSLLWILAAALAALRLIAIGSERFSAHRVPLRARSFRAVIPTSRRRPSTEDTVL